MVQVKVIIEGGLHQRKEMDFASNDYTSFRTSFLKRFGNLTFTNKLNKQKSLVKTISNESINIQEFVKQVNLKTDFIITVV